MTIKLILASSSPRRQQLLQEAGYDFEIVAPSETAECGVCSGESPVEMVSRLAYQKAADVARRVDCGLILGCDTVAECAGRILGKPADEDRAREMLELLGGRKHHVYSGLCLWSVPDGEPLVEVDRTTLVMRALRPREIDEYLASGVWAGKAGAFGLQDRLGWLEVVEGSESNVVGLPLERLAEMLARLNGGSKGCRET
ncbi:MAG TPA: nucleoside triphosphate pyrophosphatase [Pirellulales bacterium]|nr:nucleoside triphosphate pyrophosphatase [Pirellulales bacterium]